jgi:hypothetical protein
VFAVTAIMVAENFRGWLGYRKAQSKMAGEYPDGRLRVPRPKIFPPVIAEAALVLCMAIASGLFVWFNPFLLKAN